jgi:predicted dehydrogenase
MTGKQKMETGSQSQKGRPQVGVCIVGCGGIAKRHALAIRRLQEKPRLFFASRTAQKAEEYRRRFGGEAAFGSYEEGLADPRVNAAVICTPHDLHLEHANLAASQGVHVLMEKPIGRTLEEADEIIRALQDAKPKIGNRCILMVAENFRYKPSVRKAKRLIDSGIVGQVKSVRVKISGFARHGGWRADVNRMGGGALLDGGIHWVDTLLYWAGPPRRVFAMRGEKTRDNVPLEDTVHVLTEHEGGIISELSHSWGIPSPGRFQFSSISGTEGTLYVENHGYFLWLTGNRKKLLTSPLRDWPGFTAMHEDFHRVVNHQFRAAAKNGHPAPADLDPETSGLEGRRALAFVLAVYRSFQEGRGITL